jgi:glycosyltransferase involved in cell wall biosynthesis
LPWRFIVPVKPRTPLDMLRLVRATIRFFREEKPHRVVTALPAGNVMAALGAWWAGAKGVVCITHHSPAETHNALLTRVDAITGGLASVRSIVSVSDAVASSLDGKPAAYRAKRVTIHNAMPPVIEAQLAALAARHTPRTARSRRVVAVGRLAAQKNYPVLIRAAQHMPDVRVEILGDGELSAELRALADQLGVADRVIFHGRVPRETALEMLAEGDILAQPSLFEGHSLALVEGAKLGVPLVVSDVPSQVEGVTAPDGTRCGIVVPLEDDRALAQALLGLLNDPAAYARYHALALALGAAASYERMIDAYEALMGDAE